MPTSYQILKDLRMVLKPAGFKLSGTTFHRVTDIHFIEVINLQGDGRSKPVRSAVNLGIFIPEVWVLLGKVDSLQQARAIATPREFDCAIRERLSMLVYGKDQWFDRDDPSIGEIISSYISSHGLPWFASLNSFPAITEALKAKRFRSYVGWGMQAAILKAAGKVEEARFFLTQLRDVEPVKVEILADRIGIGLKQ